MWFVQIRQGGTGAILWTGAAANEIQAMDAMPMMPATMTTLTFRRTCVAV
ncbi:hypothetical protein MEX01_39620 [Methylorubrum extorquens]|nr:hypothetical protein MEX01_39620 [Methylorubrum extorquens]